MKNFITMMVLSFAILITTQLTAQRATLMPLVAGDTIVNTGTVNKVFTATAGYSSVGIHVVVTKISGTVAGTVTPQVSLDGTNWLTLPGATALTNTDQTTNTQVWNITGGVPWTHFRIRGAGSGTMSAVLRVYYVLRKYD
jgi:hypothetical protein